MRLIQMIFEPVVVNAEKTGDEDAEDEKDDAGSGDDDHRPRRADHVALFEISLNKNWKKKIFFFEIMKLHSYQAHFDWALMEVIRWCY